MDNIDFAALLGDDDIPAPKKVAPRSTTQVQHERRVEKQKEKVLHVEPQKRKIAREVCFLIFEHL